jgi:hypothetical protein
VTVFVHVCYWKDAAYKWITLRFEVPL